MNRMEYLEDLAFEYDVPLDVVLMIADLLGPNEDHDGLVAELEDYAVGSYEFPVKKQKRRPTPQERTRAAVYATGNKWAIENFEATH